MSERAIAEKKKKVDLLKEKVAGASVVVFADYLRFTVKEITALRKKLRAEDSEFRVIKNTILERVMADTGFLQIKEHLKGTTAVLLGYKDAVSPLKVLVKHFKETEKGDIRIGVVDKNIFDKKQLSEIARLPSREVLIGKVVGGMKAPLYGLVNVLQGPIRKLVYVLNAIKDKKGGE